MQHSINTTTPNFEKQKLPRFRRLDNDHIRALESLFKKYPFLNERVEIHLPYSRAKSVFGTSNIWVWPKFDRRPVGYLIFMDGFAPCIWHPERQEGMTFRWLLPPNFCQKGATVCLANILTGESVLQIEDLLIYEGRDLWSNINFSKRWDILRELWAKLPAEQPLLQFKPCIVKPMTLQEWQLQYDPSQYWIFQADHCKSPRWFWKDTVTAVKTMEYIPPTLKRKTEITTILCALCKPYAKLNLPDTYSLYAQDGDSIGIAGISSMNLSFDLRKAMTDNSEGTVVEVKWNDEFSKYQIVRIMPDGTPVSAASFFNKS